MLSTLTHLAGRLGSPAAIAISWWTWHLCDYQYQKVSKNSACRRRVFRLNTHPDIHASSHCKQTHTHRGTGASAHSVHGTNFSNLVSQMILEHINTRNNLLHHNTCDTLTNPIIFHQTYSLLISHAVSNIWRKFYVMSLYWWSEALVLALYEYL